MFEVNYLPVLTGAVLNMILGAFWYSPVLFAEPWTKLTGRKFENIHKSQVMKLYAITFLLSLVSSYVLAYFVYSLNATTLTEGAQIGFWAGIGFGVTTAAPDYLFAGRALKLFLINVSYQVISLILVGAVLAVWR